MNEQKQPAAPALRDAVADLATMHNCYPGSHATVIVTWWISRVRELEAENATLRSHLEDHIALDRRNSHE